MTDSQLEWTGERYLPEIGGIIALEHLHRYLVACQIVAGKSVLDIASGEGYGSAMLAQTAHMVIGVDISTEAVHHAREKYKATNLKFKVGSCSDMPLKDNSVDVVVSFETIEHHDDHQGMMIEVKRVLKPGGVLIISSPDKLEYSDKLDSHNEFHVKELYRDEFKNLLEVSFNHHRIYGQKVVYGSAILSEEGSSDVMSYDLADESLPSINGIPFPLYLVAVASDGELPVLGSGVLEQPINQTEYAQGWAGVVGEKNAQIDSLNNAMLDRDGQIENLSGVVADRDGQIENLSGVVADRDGQIENLSGVVADRDGQIDSLNQIIAELKDQVTNLTDETVRRGEWALGLKAELEEEQYLLQTIVNSNSWQISLPLREARRWLNNPILQAKRYTKSSLCWTKRFYQSLPLSFQTKAAHRNVLAKYFPRVLLTSGSQQITISRLNISRPEQSLPVAEQSPLDSNDRSTIDIQTSVSPKVSIIIPVYGEIDYTLRCLESISSNSPQVAYEIIVVDDCSPDNSVELLTDIKEIRLLRNTQNQGFIRSCNLGAKAAQGGYLCFLNNDTEVTAGWLDELLRTFQEFPGTGLAGSKLIYPDGRLQEAGGIIWQDGSAWNFGRLQDPQLPVYNYAREVDYCSGASIMVPRSLFVALGGFDEHYLPAYCEDSDLALKIRDKGYRVIYQPLSTVIHYEGVTSGTDISQGVKAYQVENSKKQYERWKNRITCHERPGEDIDNAKDRRATRRVLVVDHCTPTPDQDSGSIDIYNIMLLLREMNFQVTFIPEDNFLYMPKYTTALQRMGVEVLYAPYITSVEKHLKTCNNRYDLVFLLRPVVAERHMKTIRKLCPKAKILFHTVDLHFLRMTREAELNADQNIKKAAEEMRKREINLVKSADITTVVSSLELTLLSQQVPTEKVRLLPYSRNIEGTNKGFDERKDIVFVGGYQHTPNIDAVKYFVAEIMPLLRQRLTGVRFYAVGSTPPVEIQALSSNDVIIAGFVEDLTSFFEKMRVSVAPLRYGAGIKGKIGSAMAVGLPIVATTLAAEGMSLSDGENIILADGAEQFADAIVKLYKDKTVWSRISRNEVEFSEKAWGAEIAWNNLSSVLSDISIDTIRRTFPLSQFSGSNVTHKDIENNLIQLSPVASIQNREELVAVLDSNPIKKIKLVEKSLLITSNKEEFAVDGFCVPCNKKVFFKVDMQSGGQRLENGWVPNWRERLECPLCGMNNRQRLIATLVLQRLKDAPRKKVYLMEQVTPIYKWAIDTFNDHRIIGSEYLGYEYQGGSNIKGIRHEDVEALSFFDSELDLIVSNDVFEHVPHPEIAFSECARVLKSNGVMLATIPFHQDSDISVKRAEVSDGTLTQILAPSYHGNPVSAEGSLVFTDFGWDMLDEVKRAGFSNVSANIFISEKLGHLGGGQIVFEARL